MAASPKRRSAEKGTAATKVEAVYFSSPAAFRKWLEKNHAKSDELLVGFYKVGSGKPSLTWPQSVDQALCFGWIDGVRRSVDEERYTIRFTPRKPRSTWSVVNIRRVGELLAEGLMQPAGMAAFERRESARSGIYSYEQRPRDVEPELEAKIRAGSAAGWSYFSAQPPWYRRAAQWWVISAKKEETRERRLATLIALSAEGKQLPQFIPINKRK
ncbi:MAG: hypothetical protein JWN02_860 [Acidobacteria bacterium]|nr:hypothetical protein [Acidobacteriota bacterium]